MIISEQQRRELDAYIKALEKFCAYSINEKISSFWKIATKPRLISEWRKRTAIDLYQKEFWSRFQYPKQDPGIILCQSGYFEEPISDDQKVEGLSIIDKETDDYIEAIKDIDRQICKGICAELCDPDAFNGTDLTDEQRMAAITELRKPIKREQPKGENIVIGGSAITKNDKGSAKSKSEKQQRR